MGNEYIDVGQNRVPVKINKRAKRIILRQGSGGVVIVIPSRRHLKTAIEFANQRESWIDKHSQAQLVDGDKLGLWTYKQHQGRLSIELDHFDKVIWHNPDFTPSSSILRLRKLLTPSLIERTEHWARLSEPTRDLSKASVHNFSSKWGSCDSRGDIKLTVKLGLLDDKLKDYVIAHEISHLDHQNHSRDFWAKLESLVPQAKQRRKELKELRPNIAFPGRDS